MGMPTVKYKTGRTKTNSDPNQIRSISFGGTPKRVVKRRRKGNTEVGEIGGWLGGIFILLPVLAFLIYLLPEFFLGMAVLVISLIVIKKSIHSLLREVSFSPL